MDNYKETVKFYNGIILLLMAAFLIMLILYTKEYNKNHIEDSYWSRKYDSLLNLKTENITDTEKLQ